MISTETIERELKIIAKKGRLTPEEVVRAAKHHAHPLHEAFEWNNAKAGHSYRLYQARVLIARVAIVRGPTTTVSPPVYIRDPEKLPEEQGYVEIEVLKHERTNARNAVRAELNRIATLLVRAIAVSSALGVTPELEEIQRLVDRLRGRLE